MSRSRYRLGAFLMRGCECLAGCLALLWALAACASVSPSPNVSLAALHLPDVQRIHAIDGLHLHGTAGGRIQTMAAYQPSGATGSRLLVTLGTGNTFFDLGVDGSGLRTSAPAGDCGPWLAVSPDGRWLACHTLGGGLALAPLATGQTQPGQRSQPARVLLLDSTDHLLRGVAWGPDSRRLAVLSSLAGGCSVAMYAANSDYSALALTGVLQLPATFIAPASGAPCTVRWLSWSPNGSWLALAQDATLYALPLAAVPAALQSNPGRPAIVAVAPSMLRVLGAAGTDGPPAWSPTSDALTITDSFQHSLIRVNLTTGARTTLLGPLLNFICAFAWTPDGQQLAFVYCGPGSTERLGPPEQLYVYTPAG